MKEKTFMPTTIINQIHSVKIHLNAKNTSMSRTIINTENNNHCQRRLGPKTRSRVHGLNQCDNQNKKTNHFRSGPHT